MLDDETLGYAGFRGNLPYISVGNLGANDKAAVFLMDYANQRRLKILARVEVKDASDNPNLIKQLKMPDYKAKIERAMILRVEALAWNCSQHITPRFTIEEIKQFTKPRRDQIEKLEAETKSSRNRCELE